MTESARLRKQVRDLRGQLQNSRMYAFSPYMGDATSLSAQHNLRFENARLHRAVQRQGSHSARTHHGICVHS